MKCNCYMRDTVTELWEDVLLLRCCLRGLLEDARGCKEDELRCLWRLSDYLEQHVKDMENLLL